MLSPRALLQPLTPSLLSDPELKVICCCSKRSTRKCPVTITMLRLKRNQFASIDLISIINEMTQLEGALQQGLFISPIIPQSSRNNTQRVTFMCLIHSQWLSNKAWYYGT
ncbi:hypothetical protein PILCRDRAFT_813684 [Piloderma croceum F 1598]|uniref:Uncharacterized protein n=1 Tax=Piloderma croceum (strain F 1598) TaxID=765440 RepID=A0A0C3GDJ7_PILCF|nr:hypothetical protein PILCRDRAFT_813684 [Piloderma croceum F 1598]